MNLLKINDVETNVNLPKFTETTFILRNNFYVVTDGVIFNYYPIKVFPSEDASPLIRLERNPPVLLEGFALIGKKIYLVPLKDLQRKIIRKSREIKRKTSNATGITESKSLSTLIADNEFTSISIIDESGTVDASELEIFKIADATWKDQIGALYCDPDEEEDDWEIEDSA